jgi:hypothetical protein
MTSSDQIAARAPMPAAKNEYKRGKLRTRDWIPYLFISPFFVLFFVYTCHSTTGIPPPDLLP